MKIIATDGKLADRDVNVVRTFCFGIKSMKFKSNPSDKKAYLTVYDTPLLASTLHMAQGLIENSIVGLEIPYSGMLKITVSREALNGCEDTRKLDRTEVQV